MSYLVHVAFAAAFLLVPCIANANPVVKCVQSSLQEAGYNPRGVDGAVGPGTQSAAASWVEVSGIELPELAADTAPQWCAALLKTQEQLPEASAGTGQLCTNYDEVLNGVWLYPNGRPALLFRYASNPDGSGCYAWLGAVPDWQISAAGTQLMEVERDGDQRAWRIGENGIFADKAARAARYVRNGFTTFGVLTD